MPTNKYPVKFVASQRETLLACKHISPEIKTGVTDAASRKTILRLTEQQLQSLEDQLIETYQDPPEDIAFGRVETLCFKVSSLLNELNDSEFDGAATREPFKPGSQQLLQFKVRLHNSKPRVWRRFQMQDGTLGDLHVVLQLVMGWENAHLHQFEIDGEVFRPESPHGDLGFGRPTKDEDQYLLSEVLPQIITKNKKPKFLYIYDFGDDWHHEVTFEGYQPPSPEAGVVRCLGGENACPLEDIGGIWGYYYRLEALADPDHPEHEYMIEWFGDDFDPTHFELKELNKKLRKYLRHTDA